MNEYQQQDDMKQQSAFAEACNALGAAKASAIAHAERIRLLDEYAKAALPALISGWQEEFSYEGMAHTALKMADACLQEREKWIKK